MPADSASNPSPRPLLGIVTILTTLAGWTLVPLLIKHFSHSIDVWTSNGWRYGAAALFWAPLIVWHLSRRTFPVTILIAALVPALCNTGGQICFAWAHYKIDPGLLTFGLRIQIVCVTIGAALMFPSERKIIASRSFLIGIALVVLGTLGTVFFDDEFGSRSSTFGIVLAMLAGVGFAGYSLGVRQYLQSYSPMLAFAVISQYTAAVTVGLMFLLGDRFGAGALALSPEQFALLIFSSLIGIAIGHVCYYISIAQLGVAVSTGVIQIQPFCVLVCSYFLFGEVLGLAQLVSGTLAVGGAAMILVVQHLRSRSSPDEDLLHAEPEEYGTLPLDHVIAAAVDDEAEE